jgi:hypothetical protein
MLQPKFKLGDVVHSKVKEFTKDMVITGICRLWWKKRHTFAYKSDWFDGNNWRNPWCIEEELKKVE